MRINVKETAAGLGNNSVPAGYNRPNFGVGTATQPSSPNPDALLAADSAAATPNGIDPLNRGYRLGGAYDPLAEFEPAANNPSGMSIGGGRPPAPISSPGFPPMASSSFKEDGIGMNPDGTPIGELEDTFAEDNPFTEDDPFAEDDVDQTFENTDAIPAFEDIEEDPALAALPVDADGIIQPVVIPDEEIMFEEPELGEIPDVVLPFEEPILDITEDDVDVAIPENAFENDGMPEAIPVGESFKLPENQGVIVSKGDQIFMLGHVREEFTPKFAECVFSRALKSLAESRREKGAAFKKVGQKHEKVAIAGRSMLVEVARDWMLPGTNTVFEAHDLLQIVSAKPVREAKEAGEAEDEKDKSGKPEKAKKEDDAEVEKAKKEALLAYRRWKEKSKKPKKEDDDTGDDIDEDDDSGDEEEKAEKKAKKERAKREAALLERQRTNGWL